MKSLLMALGLMLASTLAYSQEQTLFNDFDVTGAFGGPFIELGRINGQTGQATGGGGALQLDNFFLGGYGLRADYADYRSGGTDYRLRLGHGGFWLGATTPAHRLLHFYTDLKLGWGRARIDGDGPAEQSDRVFVLTPQAGFEINVFEWFKLAFTGGYRYVSGVTQLEGLDRQDFSSPVGFVTFRFGGF